MSNFFRKITSWSRYNKDKQQYEHNHIENGWVSQYQSTPYKHSSWKKGIWRKFYGVLDYKNRVHLINSYKFYLLQQILIPLIAALFVFIIWILLK